MAVDGITATYIAANQFSVTGNQTADFHAGRRCKAELTGGDVYSTISGSVFGAVTTVTLYDSELDNTLTKVWYGIGWGGIGSLPDHTHDGAEGSGGELTISGTDGDYLARDGSTPLTGDWNFGSQTISGTGDIWCNDLHTAGTSLYVGDYQLKSLTGATLSGSGALYLGGGVTTGGESLALNQNNTGNRYAYIDFVADDTYTDYGFRIIRHNAGINTDSEMRHRGTGDFYFRLEDGGGEFKFQNISTDILRLDTTGLIVGDGVDQAPDYPLHVKDSAAILGLDGSGSTSDVGIRFERQGVTKWHIWNDATGSGEDDVFRLRADGSDWDSLRISNASYGVGIGFDGTRVPDGTRLSIVADEAVATFTMYQYYDGSSGAAFSGYKARGNDQAAPTAVVADDVVTGYNAFAYDGSTFDAIGKVRHLVESISSGNVKSYIEFHVSDASGVVQEMARINSTGMILGDGVDQQPDYVFHVLDSWAVMSLDGDGASAVAGIVFDKQSNTQWYMYNDGANADTFILESDSVNMYSIAIGRTYGDIGIGYKGPNLPNSQVRLSIIADESIGLSTLTMYQYSDDSGGCAFAGSKARGADQSNPTAAQADDVITGYNALAHDGTVFDLVGRNRHRVESINLGDIASYWELYTSDISGTAREVMRMHSTGDLELYEGGITVAGTSEIVFATPGTIGVLTHIDVMTVASGIVTFDGHIRATVSGAYDIGTSDYPFRDIYLTGGSVYLNAEKISSPSSGIIDFNNATIINATISGGGGGVTEHSALNELDYTSAAHTGFVSIATTQTITGLKTFSQDVTMEADLTAVSGTFDYVEITDSISEIQFTSASGIIGVAGDEDLLLLSANQLTIQGQNASQIVFSTSSGTIGVSTNEDILTFYDGGVIIEGNNEGSIEFSTASGTIGVSGHTDLLTVTSGIVFFDGHIRTTVSGAYDIGEVALPFRDIYLTGGSIYLEDSSISLDAWGNFDFGDKQLITTGPLQIGNTIDTNPGLMRWTGTDFEGYKASEWVSLTSGDGGGGGGSGSLVFVENHTVASGTVSYDITDLPQTADWLVIKITGQCVRTGTPYDTIRVRFNDDSGTNYDSVWWYFNANGDSGSSGVDGVDLTSLRTGELSSSTDHVSPNAAYPTMMQVFNYSDVTKTTSMLGDGYYVTTTHTNSDLIRSIFSGEWVDTSAVTKMTFFLHNGSDFDETDIVIYGYSDSAVLGSGGTGGANWILVDETTVISGTLDWTPTGTIDGDSDEELLVKYQLKERGGSGSNAFAVQLNSDTGSNYERQWHWWGTAHSATETLGADSIWLHEDNSGAWDGYGEAVIHMRSGTKRMVRASTAREQTGGNSYGVHWVGEWNNSVDNITSARFFTTDSFDYIKVRVYKWSETGSGASTFLEHTDSPTTYSGSAGKSVVVNQTEDGLEFTTISGGDGSLWTQVGNDAYYSDGDVVVSGTTGRNLWIKGDGTSSIAALVLQDHGSSHLWQQVMRGTDHVSQADQLRLYYTPDLSNWHNYMVAFPDNNADADPGDVAFPGRMSIGQDVAPTYGFHAVVDQALIEADGSGSGVLRLKGGTTSKGGIINVVESDDTAGILTLQTGGATTVQIDKGGGVFIGGNDISKWNNFSANDLVNLGFLTMLSNATTYGGIVWNWYNDGSNRYQVSGGAGELFMQLGGDFIWNTAPSGTADTVMTLAQRMQLTNEGMLLVGDATTNAGMTIGITIDQDDNDDEAFAIKSSDVSQPFQYAESDTYFSIRKRDASLGGTKMRSFSDGDSNAFKLEAFIGSTDPTDTTAAITLAGYKSDGSDDVVVLGNDERVFEINNFNTTLMTVLGGGNVGINTGTPSAMLDVNSLSTNTLASYKIWENDADGVNFLIGKSRGASVGSYTIVQDDDALGRVLFQGTDGDQFLHAAAVTAEVDGTPSNNVMYGRLVFQTNEGTLSTLSDRMTILSDGKIHVGPIVGGGRFNIVNEDSANPLRLFEYYDGAGGASIMAYKARGSQASPAAVQAGDYLGGHLWYGWDGSTWDGTGYIENKVTSISSGNIKSYMHFAVSDDTGTRNVEFKIHDDLIEYYDNTISGTGDIYCNDIYTASGTVYIGSEQISSSSPGLLDFGSSNLQSTGHTAIGNDADIDFPGYPTYEILLNVQENFDASIIGAYGMSLYARGAADSGSASVRGISANAMHTGSGQFSILRGVTGAAYTNTAGATGTNIQGIYGSAYIGESNTTVTNLIGGYFTAGAVFGMTNTSGINVTAGQFRPLPGGTGDFSSDNVYGVQILTPGASYNGTLTNLYGLYIEDMTSSSMSFANEYNIYSAGATSKNYFEGDIYCNDIYTASGTVYIGDEQISSTAPGVLDFGGATFENATIPGVSGGNWVLADSTTHSGSALNWTVSDLDGDAYEWLLIEGDVDASGVNDGIDFQFNGDTGSNYERSRHWFGNTHDDADESGTFITLIDWGSGGCTGKFRIYVGLRTGTIRTVRSEGNRKDKTSGNQYGMHYSGHWNNTSSNVTSITFLSSLALTTKLKVYRWTAGAADYTKGRQELSIEYATTSGIDILPGRIDIEDGSSQYALQVSGTLFKDSLSLSADTWYYVYTKPPVSGNYLSESEIELSTTEPTRDVVKRGYYHGSNTDWRCFSAFYSDVNSEVKPFMQIGDEWKVTGSIINQDVDAFSSTSWTEATFTLPFGETFAIIDSRASYGDTYSHLRYKKKGVSGDNYTTIGTVRVDNTRSFGEYHLPIDSDKKGEILWSAAGTQLAYLNSEGFVLPDWIAPK